MGYTLATLNALNEKNAELLIIHWGNKKKLTKFKPIFNKTIKDIDRDKSSFITILHNVMNYQPDIIVVSGWMDLAYLPACIYARFVGIKVVVCIDDQWHGTLKQNFASFLSLFSIFKVFFSHAWICGPRQFHYASKIGFNPNKIINDLYSCDSYKYSKINNTNIYQNRNFIYVGRFDSEKGIDLLFSSWTIFSLNYPDWTLTLVGSSKFLKNANFRNVIYKSFLSPDEIIEESLKSTCFILPSLFEPWGVVVHEFASLGLPIIVSDSVGAQSSFVINNFNGYIFKSGDYKDLLNKMIKIANLSYEELCLMSSNSNILSRKITPDSSAFNLLSIIDEPQ